MTDTISLNTTPLEYLQVMKPDDDLEMYREVYIKNRFPSEISEMLLPKFFYKVIVAMIMNLNLKTTYRYQYVDIKVQKLKKNQNTANGLWHLDSSLNPDYEFDNQLYVSGLARTEFLTNQLEVTPSKTLKEFDAKIKEHTNTIISIPENTIVRFDGRAVHRGVFVDKDHTRLLIRLVNTDKQLPRGL